jgi:hypothetical protein
MSYVTQEGMAWYSIDSFLLFRSRYQAKCSSLLALTDVQSYSSYSMVLHALEQLKIYNIFTSIIICVQILCLYRVTNSLKYLLSSVCQRLHVHIFHIVHFFGVKGNA